MPSPLGHALGGVAAGCLVGAVAGRRRHEGPAVAGTRPARADLRQLGMLAGLGMLADIDFLFGVHSAYTHSVGATLVVGLVLGARARRGGAERGWWVSVVTAAAYGSHVLLDYLGTDTVAPLGVMALWPLSFEYHLSELHVFRSVCREVWELGCWQHNAVGTFGELALLGPVAALATWLSVARWTQAASRGTRNQG